MAEQNPTVIIAHLDDEKLRKSIDSLVGYVDKQFQSMVSTTTTKVGEIQAKLNELSQIKVDSNGSADGGSSRRAKAIQSERQSLESLQMSYDKLLGALQMAQRQERIFAGKDIWTLTREELDKYSATLQRVSELEKSLSAIRGQMSLAMVEKGNFAPNMKEYTDGLVRTSDELKKMSAYYKGLEKDAQRAFRVDLANAMKMPTTTIDEIRMKWVALKRLIEEPSAVGVFTPNQIANAKSQLDDLWGQLSRNRALQEQINADTQQQIVATNQLVEAEQKYGVEIAHTAQYFRESAEGFNQLKLASKDGFFTISNPVYNAEAKSLEEQLLSYKALNQEANLQLEVEKAIAIERQKTAQAAQESTAERQRYNEQRQLEKTNIGEYDQLRATIASVIGVEQNQVRMADIENDSYKALSATLKQLKEAYNSLQSSGRKSETGETIIAEIQAVQRGMQEIQKTMARPVSLDAAFNLPEKTLDQITYKVQMLRSYIQNLDVVEERGDIRKVEDAIERLNQKSKDAQQSTRKIIEDVNKIRFDNISKMPTENIGQIGAKIKEVRQYINDLKDQSVFDEKSLKRAESLLDSLTKKFDKLHKVQGTDSNVNSALRMQANTLNEIAEKTQRLHAIRANLDPTKQADLIQRVNNALRDLGKRQDEILGKNQQLMNSNNALARSWNYMKNRLAFYFTVGASTQFVKNLIEVRSQYEMNERALGILIDSAERGTQIFNELSQMALVSPYTLIELSTAAKQLSAYDVAAKDLVDTTRRLADLSAAVGIPVERLTTALGQIKAFEHLTSLTARRFASAGIPLVKALADHYTELEGRMVSVADVYDRMKKKAISYNDVMAVITEMTDEGGKFFDFQAKMADTLKVQLANLTLAWNNMLNEIGKSEQGVLVGGIKGLKELFLQWKNIEKAALAFGISLGLVKTAQIFYLIFGAKINKQLAVQAVLGQKAAHAFDGLGASLMKVATNPWTWVTIGVAMLANLALTAYQADEAIKKLNKSIIDAANERVESINKTIANLNSQYNFEEFAPAEHMLSSDVSKDEAKKIWETIREEIELSSSSAQEFINRLENIDDINVRVGKGFDYLKDIQKAQAALSQLDIKDIDVEQDMAGWYNLYALQDGLIENFRDMQKEAGRAEKDWKDYTIRTVQGFHWGGGLLGAIIGGIGIKGNEGEHLKRYQEDLQTTVDSIIASMKKYNVEGANVQREFFATSMDKILQDTDLTEKERLKIRIDAQELFYQSEVKSWQKAIAKETGDYKNALQQELNDFIAFHEQRNGYTLGFEQWLQKTQITMLTETFGKMSAEELKRIDFSKGEWYKWAYDISKKFAEQNNLAFDDVFANLRKYLSQDFTLYIKTVLQKPDDKSVYDTLTEADKTVDEELAKIQRLKTRKGELETQGAIVAGTREIDTEYANTIQEITEAQEEYNAALAKGGHSKKESTSDTKSQKQAETELQKALKDELSLLDKVRSQYKKLTDAGVDNGQALTMVTNQFTNSIQRINNILGKNGLPLFNIKAFAGTDNPNAVLEMLKKQLDAAKVAKNIKPSEIKELEVKYGEIVIDAKVYNTKKIADGLNNELSKIKDEYELAVELDANPELGNIFTDMFGIDTTDFPKTIDEYMRRVQAEFDKATNMRGISTPLDVFKSSADDWKKWAETVGLSEEALKDFNGKFVEAQGVAKKWATDIINNTKKLEYDLAELNDKIAIKEKEQVRLKEQIENEKNEITKRYLELTYQNNEKAIDELRSQALSLMPEYARVFNSIAEHSAGVARRLQRDLMKVFDAATFDSASNKWTLTSSNGQKTILNDTQYRKEREKLTKEMRKSQSTFQKIKEAFNPSEKDGVVDYAKGIELIAEEAKKAADGLHTVADIVTTLGGSDEAVETLNDIATSMEGAATAAQGFTQIQSGDYIGGAVNVLKGTWQAVSTWFDNGDKSISREIAASEYQVKKLELAYIDLEHAINEAYGMATLGAKRAALANKELQLAELKRQLTLEQSRKKKNQDQNRILDLKKQIKELEYDIKETSDSIVNDLLGISSVGDAMDSFMDGFIDALRNGEDAMAVFDESVDDMVANMVKKMFTTKILQPWFEDVWDKIQQGIEQRSANEFERAKMTDEQIWQQIMHDRGYRRYLFAWRGGKGGYATQEDIDKYREDLQKDLIRATEPTTNDIKKYAELLRTGQPIMEDSMEEIRAFLEELNLINKSKDDNLSSLQQGLQGMSEETAGALEAYMNGVSQQVYLHSDLLTQIRDAVVSFDLDVSNATQAEMLLQLQQSYAVHLAIQSILQGWSNPSGQAVRVEMI